MLLITVGKDDNEDQRQPKAEPLPENVDKNPSFGTKLEIFAAWILCIRNVNV